MPTHYLNLGAQVQLILLPSRRQQVVLTTIDIDANGFTDAAGNNNTAATQFNWTYDGVVPSITGTTVAADNTTIATTFSEAVYRNSNKSHEFKGWQL